MNKLPRTDQRLAPKSARPALRSARRVPTGAILRGVVLAVVLGSIGALSVAMVPRYHFRQPAPPPPLTGGELETTLLRTGISPQALAAAGLSGSDATGIVGRARSALAESVTALRAADQAASAAREQVDGLERRVRSGLGGPQDVADLGAARTALGSAKSTLEAQLEALRSAALSDQLSPGSLQTLSTIRGNQRWRFPTEYLCKSAQESEWLGLRRALSVQRQAQRENEEVPAAAQTTLTAWGADQAVATARANLANLDAVKAAWRAAIDQH